MNTIIELAYELLLSLKVRHIKLERVKGILRYEISWKADNQQIIAYGDSEQEVMENFYYLYQELVKPA